MEEEEKWRRTHALNSSFRGGSSRLAPSHQNHHHHPFFHHHHASSPFSNSSVRLAAGSPHSCRAPFSSPPPSLCPPFSSSHGSSMRGHHGRDSLHASGFDVGSSSPSSSLFLPNKSAYVGAFRHAPATRGFKDLCWEPSFLTARPSLTQMDIARQERFKTRHVGPLELMQLPTTLYKELMVRRRRERLQREIGVSVMLDEDDEEAIFVFGEGEAAFEGEERWEDDEAGGERHLCVICLEGFTPWDRVRELPACPHIHHQRCLDIWLRGAASYEACHTRSCPTCKTPISFSASSTPTTPSAAVEVAEEQEKMGAKTDGGQVCTVSSPRSILSNIFEIPRWAYARAGNSLMQDAQHRQL